MLLLAFPLHRVEHPLRLGQELPEVAGGCLQGYDDPLALDVFQDDEAEFFLLVDYPIVGSIADHEKADSDGQQGPWQGAPGPDGQRLRFCG